MFRFLNVLIPIFYSQNISFSLDIVQLTISDSDYKILRFYSVYQYFKSFVCLVFSLCIFIFCQKTFHPIFSDLVSIFKNISLLIMCLGIHILAATYNNMAMWRFSCDSVSNRYTLGACYKVSFSTYHPPFAILCVMRCQSFIS